MSSRKKIRSERMLFWTLAYVLITIIVAINELYIFSLLLFNLLCPHEAFVFDHIFSYCLLRNRMCFFLVRFLQIELTWGVHFWYDQVRCNLQIDLLILLYYFPILSDLLNKWSCELKEGNISTLTTLITKNK